MTHASNLPQRRNMSQAEQTISIIAGTLLGLWALRRAPLGVILTVIGGFLIYRGTTAHCPIYALMDITIPQHDLAVSQTPSEEQIDATLGDSFPASDPPGWTSGSSFTQVDR
jgi:uncharacterized membrane protein